VGKKQAKDLPKYFKTKKRHENILDIVTVKMQIKATIKLGVIG
jgi:hypothetical protein